MDQLLIGIMIASLGVFLTGAYYYSRFTQARYNLMLFLGQWKQAKSSNRHGRKRNWGNRCLKWADKCSSLGGRFAFPDSPEEVERLLDRSGRPYQMSGKEFLGSKILFASWGLGAAIIGTILGIPFANYGLILFPLTGFFLPVLWLRKNARLRQEKISRDMPDFLDIMSVTLQAGLSIDQTLQQIRGLFIGPLSDELERFSQEIELGVEREFAWNRLLERNSAPELQRLIKSMIQGNRLGIPIATTLRMQAEETRRIRMEKLKEQAAKASPKITTITTVLMAPAVFIMVMGLLILNVFYNPKGLGLDRFFN